MGKKITVEINCELEIDEDSLRLSPESREEDIQSEIKWATQRVQDGFDERVAWSIDYYLNENMPKWLTSLCKHGTPSSMFTKEELEEAGGISNESHEKAHARWNEQIQIMIAGFEAAKEIEDKWITESEDNEHWKAFHLGMDTFKKHYFSLWD